MTEIQIFHLAVVITSLQLLALYTYILWEYLVFLTARQVSNKISLKQYWSWKVEHKIYSSSCHIEKLSFVLFFKCNINMLHCQLKFLHWEATQGCVFHSRSYGFGVCLFACPFYDCRWKPLLLLKFLRNAVSYHLEGLTVDSSYAMNCWFKNCGSILLDCCVNGLM